MKIGITGNIGSGKSYVCNILSELGVPIYNSDIEARKYLYYPDVLKKIKNYFDECIFLRGALDRKRLGEIVFSDKEKLKYLQSLIYPYLEKDLNEWYEKQGTIYSIIESATLFETGLDKTLNRVITVSAPKDIRMKRVLFRDNVSEEYFNLVESNQMNQEEKISNSDYVIINHNTDVIKEVTNLNKQILSDLSINRICVQCGYCCSTCPCSYGKWNKEKHECEYLSEENNIGQRGCTKYDEIKNKPGWKFHPAFESGCSSTIGNIKRLEIIKKLK